MAAGAGPCDIIGVGPGLRGPGGAGTPGPQRPPAARGHLASTHQGPSAKNRPGCVATASAGRGPLAGQGGVDGEVPPAARGFRCVGRSERPLFACPPAMLFQMRQLEAHCRELWTWRLERPGMGRHDMFPAGLPAAGWTRAAATGAISAIAAPAGAARPARGGNAGARRAVAPPQVALCARHRALLCAACAQRGADHWSWRAHEGHCMDATQARVAVRALRAWLQPAPPAGPGPAVAPLPVWDPPRGRKCSRSRSSSPEQATRSACPASRECARRPGDPSDLPLPSRLDRGGTQPKRLTYGRWARGAPAALAAPPPPSLPPERTPVHGGAAGVGLQVPQAPADSPGGRHQGGGGRPVPLAPLYLLPFLLPRAGGHFRERWPQADDGPGRVPAPGVGTDRPPGVFRGGGG